VQLCHVTNSLLTARQKYESDTILLLEFVGFVIVHSTYLGAVLGSLKIIDWLVTYLLFNILHLIIYRFSFQSVPSKVIHHPAHRLERQSTRAESRHPS